MEFALINRYFRDLGATRSDVELGIGDDAALVRPPSDMDLVSACATLDAHNASADNPESMGYTLLATALTRLSALGGRATWLTLAMTLPQADEHWLAEFCRGLARLARRHELALIGGDTTSGPLTTTAVVTGTVPGNRQLSPRGARVGDRLVVSGELGLASLMMLASAVPARFAAQKRASAFERFAFPEPPLDAVPHLLEYASAAADLTEGMSHALETMLEASDVGASVNVAALPVDADVRALAGELTLWEPLLESNADQEICFSIAAEDLTRLQLASARTGARYTDVGVVESTRGLRWNKATLQGAR